MNNNHFYYILDQDIRQSVFKTKKIVVKKLTSIQIDLTPTNSVVIDNSKGIDSLINSLDKNIIYVIVKENWQTAVKKLYIGKW